MKSFKRVIAEVAQPKPEEEQAFKDQHTYEVMPHPVALDHQFTGDIAKPKASRIADQEGDSAYDTAYAYGMNAVFEAAALKESPEEEIPMMSQQLDFIAMAAKTIKDSLKGGGDPEEWYQNKLGTAHDAIKTLYANIKGDKDTVDEGVKKEALVGGQKELDHDKDGDIDGADFAALRAKKKAKTEASCGTPKKMKEEVELDESVETLDETFKAGIVKLDDGKQVVIKKQDADLLNSMLKDLSPASRKSMTKVAMTDNAGFKEILGFAREAL